jgi:hypothetical protein
MQATMKQTTTDEVAAPEPTVTYDRETLTINATVVAFNGPNGLSIHPPVIAVPGSGSTTPVTWTLVWTVVPDPNTLTSVHFEDPGIIIPSATSSLPSAVSVSGLAAVEGNPSTQWHVEITNGCTDANAFSYDVAIGADANGLELSFRTAEQAPEDRTIDPTIAVVKEPIDG